jgi:hypothetical protein
MKNLLLTLMLLVVAGISYALALARGGPGADFGGS